MNRRSFLRYAAAAPAAWMLAKYGMPGGETRYRDLGDVWRVFDNDKVPVTDVMIDGDEWVHHTYWVTQQQLRSMAGLSVEPDGSLVRYVERGTFVVMPIGWTEVA